MSSSKLDGVQVYVLLVITLAALDESSSKNDASGNQKSESLHDEPDSEISDEESDERQVIKEIENN